MCPETRVTQARVTEAHLASGSSTQELRGDKSSSETQARVTVSQDVHKLVGQKLKFDNYIPIRRQERLANHSAHIRGRLGRMGELFI